MLKAKRNIEKRVALIDIYRNSGDKNSEQINEERLN